MVKHTTAGFVIGLAALWCGPSLSSPPVNQTIGMVDQAYGTMTEADCRVCHDSGVPDRHHLLYGQPVPVGTLVPYPDADGDGFIQGAGVLFTDWRGTGVGCAGC